ncbi:unnamed protein product [Parajaminaea phylloscopi]
MDTVAYACIEAPWLFDIVVPGADPQRRADWPPKELEEPLLELAKANSFLTPRPSSKKNASKLDALFGKWGNVQGAHCLSHSRRDSLALHLFWEVLGVQFSLKTSQADDLAGPSAQFKKWKASERNVFGCDLNNHSWMDTDGSFLPIPADVQGLIYHVEEDLKKEEQMATGSSWEWDLTHLNDGLNLLRQTVAGKPVDLFRPWFLPADIGQGPSTVTYHTQAGRVLYHSSLDQYETMVATSTQPGADSSEDADMPACELPLTFARSAMSGGSPETGATELPPSKLFLDPLNVTVFTRSVLKRRQNLAKWHDDWLFPRHGRAGPRISSVFKQYDECSRYLVQLLCSKTPSAYRFLERPATLEVPLTVPSSRVNQTSRRFHWLERADTFPTGERASSPHSGFREWRRLVTLGIREINLADVDSGPPVDMEHASLPQLLSDFYSRTSRADRESLLRKVRLESENLTLDDAQDVERAIAGELSSLTEGRGPEYLVDMGLAEIEGAEEMLWMLDGITRGIRERAEGSKEAEYAGDATQVSQASSGSASSKDYSGIEAATERLLAERAEAMRLSEGLSEALSEGKLASLAPDAEAIAAFQSAR